MKRKAEHGYGMIVAAMIGGIIGFAIPEIIGKYQEIDNSEKYIKMAETLACSPGAKAHLMSIVDSHRRSGHPMTKEDFDALSMRLSKFPRTDDCLSSR